MSADINPRNSEIHPRGLSISDDEVFLYLDEARKDVGLEEFDSAVENDDGIVVPSPNDYNWNRPLTFVFPGEA